MEGTTKRRGRNLPQRIFFFYYDGFMSMTVGKRLWIIILVKLFVLFAILKIFFFHDFLRDRFDTDKARGEYVIEQLTTTQNK
jgi:hypothetical protein